MTRDYFKLVCNLYSRTSSGERASDECHYFHAVDLWLELSGTVEIFLNVFIKITKDFRANETK